MLVLMAPGALTVSEPFARPSWIVLLAETTAPAPMTVAKVRLPEAASALAPIKMLFEPVVLLKPAASPRAELKPPVALDNPAIVPKKEFPLPEELIAPASWPKKELAAPSMFALP